MQSPLTALQVLHRNAVADEFAESLNEIATPFWATNISEFVTAS